MKKKFGKEKLGTNVNVHIFNRQVGNNVYVILNIYVLGMGKA